MVIALSITPMIVNAQEKVNWLTWEQAAELNKSRPRKVLVDVYTDWCGWCKVMDKNTFQQPQIAKYINETYYPVKFNAEQRSNIEFKSKVYKYVRQGSRGYHEFAAELMNGKLSFPTVVFLDENLNVIQPVDGYQEPARFQMIMTYFGKDIYKSMPWTKYEKQYSPTCTGKKP